LRSCESSRLTRSRPGSTFSSPLLVAVPLALASHHVHGPSIGYAAIALAAAASWFGVPGPGEAVLIGAAVLAARHRLDIGPVIVVAAIGATLGGIAGWLAGIKVSRRVLTAKGPLLTTRRRMIKKGEDFFERHGPLGVFLAPSWAAGIHNMRASRFIPLNTIAAIGWAVVYGGIAYLVGPSVAEVLGDLGSYLPLVLIAAVIVLVVVRRRRRRSKVLRNQKIGLREG
jgi:membrane protein DedA with SNARE-associated domain